MPALGWLLYRGLPEPATPDHLAGPAPAEDAPGAGRSDPAPATHLDDQSSEGLAYERRLARKINL